MSRGVQYTLYHPRWYRRHVSVWWWLKSWRYTRFVLRELTSLFVVFACGVNLWQMRALAGGADAYAEFVDLLRSPAMIALNAVAFLAVLYHAVTWFRLAPQAMPVRLAGRKVPDSMIVAANFLAWFVASGIVAWIWLRG